MIRIDLGPWGVVFKHAGWGRWRLTDRVRVHRYANGWQRRVRVQSDGRALYVPWVPLTQ